ncbi:MAG: HAD family phosphatase [Lachnospiraceae bacterium]|nr:HAD family phosphatase [Lachnospiraceae bacterium]
MVLDNKKAVIFDLDGSLVDSMWIWKQIDIDYLGRFGHSLPETLQEELEGKSFRETAIYIKERFRIEDSIEEMMDDWNQMAWDKYMHEVPLKDGADRFLEECKKRGVLLGIASSNSRELVENVLGALQIREYFSCIMTGSEVGRGKPAPDIYLEVAQKLSVNPTDCLVFEDIVAGIMAGKSAGMTVYAVEDAYSAHQEEKKRALADGFIRSYQELFSEER